VPFANSHGGPVRKLPQESRWRELGHLAELILAKELPSYGHASLRTPHFLRQREPYNGRWSPLPVAMKFPVLKEKVDGFCCPVPSDRA
jgi:hypothetical protein